MNDLFFLSFLALIFAILSIFTFKNQNYGNYINCNKIFYLFFLLIYLPAILIYPDIYIQDYKLNFFSTYYPEHEIIKRSIIIFILFMLAFSIANVFFKKRDLNHLKNYIFKEKNYNLLISSIYLFLILLSILNIEYRIVVFKYVFGFYTYDESSYLRRYGNEDLLIINYFRYNLIFINILLFSLFIKKKYGLLSYTCIYFFSIIFICGNISKLFYIFASTVYLFSIVFDSPKKHFLEDKISIFFKATIYLILFIFFLAFLYSYVEHGGKLNLFDGIRLVIYRVFASSWSDLVFHVKAFPDILDYTFFKQSSLISKIFSLEYFSIGNELVDVSHTAYGKNTTIAASFIAHSWAFAGFISVFIFTIIFSWVLKFIDRTIVSLNIYNCKIALFSYSLSLPIINLHSSIFTSLLHYGMLIGPLYFIILEKIFIIKNAKKID